MTMLSAKSANVSTPSTRWKIPTCCRFASFQIQRPANRLALCCLLAHVFQLVGDQAIVDDLQVLADIGSGGKYANKMHVDLLKSFSFKTTFQEPHGEQSQTMLLPHEMFATIAESYRTTWHRSIYPGEHKLLEFWETAQNHPLLKDHPVREREDWTKYCIPFGLHGDGVPVVGLGKAWSKILNVFSFFSLIGTGNTRSKMFYCYSAFDKISIPGFPHGPLQEPLFGVAVVFLLAFPWTMA